MKAFIIGFALALLIVPGTVNAATLDIIGPSEVLLADETFTFDVILKDLDGLTNLDFWNIGLELSPATGAVFDSATGKTDPDYIFSGNSYDFGWALEGGDPYKITIADLTIDALGVENFTDKLLATVMVDIKGATMGDLFSVNLYGFGTWTLFGDKDMNFDFTGSLLAPYQFQVVPVPAAVWLLGSGLLGLITLRRKK